MLTATNVLSVPEVSAYERFGESDECYVISYAIRQPGASRWSAVAGLVLDGEVIGQVDSDAVYTDPRQGVLDVRAALTAGAKDAYFDPTLTVKKDGAA